MVRFSAKPLVGTWKLALQDYDFMTKVDSVPILYIHSQALRPGTKLNREIALESS